MTKEEMIVALDAMLEQGNQLRASELIPILAELAGSAAPIEVEDITGLTSEQLDSLNAGDKVVKVTGKQKHAYIVSYKGEGAGEGLCLTYVDASTAETVSYDRTESGWAYNSTDKGSIPPAA